MNNSKKDLGFVALTTAIILTAILLIITITLNQTSFFTRGMLLDSEYKERSAALAEACVDVARLKLANNSIYAGDELIKIGSSECKIKLIVSGNTIETIATSSNSVTNLRVQIDPSNISIESWEELSFF